MSPEIKRMTTLTAVALLVAGSALAQSNGMDQGNNQAETQGITQGESQSNGQADSQGKSRDATSSIRAEAMQAWEADRYDVAAERWATVVRSDKPAPSDHYMLGLSLWKADRLDEAAASMQQAIEMGDEPFRAYLNLSRIHNDREQYEAALEAAEKALNVEPDDGKALFLKGRSLYNLGRLDEAEAALQQSIQQDASNGYAHNMLGLIYLDSKAPSKARDEFERAHELEPDAGFIERNLAAARNAVG